MTKLSFTKLALPLKLEHTLWKFCCAIWWDTIAVPLRFLCIFPLRGDVCRRPTQHSPSLKKLAERTGLSKSAVQAALRILLRRQLIRAQHATRTAVPEYFVQRPWAR